MHVSQAYVVAVAWTLGPAVPCASVSAVTNMHICPGGIILTLIVTTVKNKQLVLY